MGDYILREIDRIGQLLRALLDRAGALGHTGSGPQLSETTHDTAAGAPLRETVRGELLTQLGLDLDTLAADPDFARRLADEHGLRDEHLELLAELCFALASEADSPAERRRMACATRAIYRHLDENHAPASFNRFLLLERLEQYLEP